MVMFPSIHMKASRPNACKCNVNLFRFVIVLFSKVVRQWGICNIFFYIIYSIYDIILSASSTYLQAPVTLPAGTTYVPAGPFCSYPPVGPSCSYLFPSCSYLCPSCRTLLQLPSCRTLLQVPAAFLQVLVAFLQEPCPQPVVSEFFCCN